MWKILYEKKKYIYISTDRYYKSTTFNNLTRKLKYIIVVI